MCLISPSILLSLSCYIDFNGLLLSRVPDFKSVKYRYLESTDFLFLMSKILLLKITDTYLWLVFPEADMLDELI